MRHVHRPRPPLLRRNQVCVVASKQGDEKMRDKPVKKMKRKPAGKKKRDTHADAVPIEVAGKDRNGAKYVLRKPEISWIASQVRRIGQMQMQEQTPDDPVKLIEIVDAILAWELSPMPEDKAEAEFAAGVIVGVSSAHDTEYFELLRTFARGMKKFGKEFDRELYDMLAAPRAVPNRCPHCFQ